MATGLTSSDDVPARRPPMVCYRTTDHGAQVVIVPIHCASGLHVLTNVGYRICETGETLQVTCQACVDIAGIDHRWRFATNGQRTESAEFDDRPYLDLLKGLAPEVGR